MIHCRLSHKEKVDLAIKIAPASSRGSAAFEENATSTTSQDLAGKKVIPQAKLPADKGDMHHRDTIELGIIKPREAFSGTVTKTSTPSAREKGEEQQDIVETNASAGNEVLTSKSFLWTYRESNAKVDLPRPLKDNSSPSLHTCRVASKMQLQDNIAYEITATPGGKKLPPPPPPPRSKQKVVPPPFYDEIVLGGREEVADGMRLQANVAYETTATPTGKKKAVTPCKLPPRNKDKAAMPPFYEEIVVGDKEEVTGEVKLFTNVAYKPLTYKTTPTGRKKAVAPRNSNKKMAAAMFPLYEEVTLGGREEVVRAKEKEPHYDEIAPF